MVGCWRENLCCKVFKCCWFQMVLDNCLQVPCSLLIADCLLLRENWDAVCKHIYERTTTAQPPLVNCSLFLHIIKSAFFSHRFISLDFMTSDSLTGICQRIITIPIYYQNSLRKDSTVSCSVWTLLINQLSSVDLFSKVIQ